MILKGKENDTLYKQKGKKNNTKKFIVLKEHYS